VCVRSRWQQRMAGQWQYFFNDSSGLSWIYPKISSKSQGHRDSSQIPLKNKLKSTSRLEGYLCGKFSPSEGPFKTSKGKPLFWRHWAVASLTDYWSLPYLVPDLSLARIPPPAAGCSVSPPSAILHAWQTSRHPRRQQAASAPPCPRDRSEGVEVFPTSCLGTENKMPFKPPPCQPHNILPFYTLNVIE